MAVGEPGSGGKISQLNLDKPGTVKIAFDVAAYLASPEPTPATEAIRGRRLDAHESDRLYRVARVAAHAFDVFGTEDNAATWLRRPNRALGGEAPIHLLDTDVGARQVEDTLGRLEHGIVS